MSRATSGISGTPDSRRLQFGLPHVIYVVTLVAVCLAAFGPSGIWLAVLALVFWTAVLASQSRPAAFRNASLVVLGGLIILGLLLPTMRTAREPARRMQCSNNLKQIALGLHNYHDRFGSFPPAFVADGNGKPLHSWRVLLLPFVEEQALYDKYNFDEPWDGPSNSKLLSQMPAVFACPSAGQSRNGRLTTASYLGIVGPETSWPGNSARRIRDFTDGPADTLLVVECPEQKIPWLEPKDLDFDQAVQLLTKQQPAGNPARGHSFGRNACFADGRIRFIGHGVARKVGLAILKVADGAAWTEADLAGSPSEERPAWLGNWLRFGGFLAVLLFPIRWVYRRAAGCGG